MAPKQKSLQATLFGGKATDGADVTPKSETGQNPAESPDSSAKRRRLDEGGSKTAAEKHATAESMATPGEIVKLAAVDMTTANHDTGPMSLWMGPSGPDRAALSSPAFDPSLRVDVPVGKPVGFAVLSAALLEIENLKGSGKGSRKTMTLVLSNMFRLLLYTQPKDLIATLYILINKVAPDYEQAELGVGDGLIVKTISEVFGRSDAHIKHALNSGEATDLGEVALQSRVAQKMLMMPPKLTIEKVFADMKFLAHASGKDSQKTKKERIQKMLVASRGEEAKFIVRMLQAKLRIGIQIPTLLQALAYSFVLTVPARESVQAVADTRKGTPKLPAPELEVRMCTMEASVKQSFSEMPNFDRIVACLLEGCDGNALLRACHISLGIPVKPMLAKPSKGIPEVVERLSGKRFTGEYKYDGERAQIHVISRDEVQIYSRNSENMTEKYPDVIKTVKESLCEGVESCIIDSELVAFDQTEKRILPFQILTTRGRKNITIENIKVHVCIYAFDCMLCNGQPLVKETLEDRRKKLRSLLKETEGQFVYASYRDFDELKEEEIQAFLDESVGGSCEGLMLKTLTDNATYEPSKRSLNWLKLKKDYMDGMADSIDVVPIGAFYGKGRRTGAYGAFLLSIYDPEAEEFQTVCKAGTGFSDEDLTTHHEFFKSRTLVKADINYNVTDKVQPDVWLEACQVWEIRAADLSISPVHTGAMGIKADGKGIGLRFPRFLRIREDKSPEESTGPDQIVEMFEAQASVSKAGGGVGDDDF